MSTRNSKSFQPGQYYHVFNRGNNKQKIFLDEQDYRVFLDRCSRVLGTGPYITKGRVRIKTYPLNSFKLISYCLMPNHYHFLLKQEGEIPVHKFVQSVCTSYVRYFNNKYSRVGRIFQNAFKAKLVTDHKYFSYLSGYIHANPNDYLTYPYSSLSSYVDRAKENGPYQLKCDTKAILEQFNGQSKPYINFISRIAQVKETL